MPRNPDGKEAIPKYHAEPPTWLTTAHSSGDLGFHGFFPPRPDQPEDILSDHNVKQGYSAPSAVGLEYFSSQSTIRESILKQNALSELEDLMNQVLARRAESHSTLPDHAFKLPQRITLNEVRKQAWHAEFLNPKVPLHTFGEKIPHARGPDILTFLQDNNVPISRAVWYVRGIGANENQGMRNRPGYTPTQYSLEWTNVVTGYLKKLLGEIMLPSAARLGLNIKQTFKSKLSDPETRDKWVSRFCYCLDLLREFYAENLVDHGAFLSWLTHQMCTSNLAQANFVARIIDEYLEGMFPYRALQRPLVDGCLAKLSEIQSTTGSEHLTTLVTSISSILQRMFIFNPDTFVNPRNWITYSSTFIQILRDSPTSVAPNRLEWESLIENDLDDVSRRNDALLFKIIPERATASAKFTMGDVKLLNSVTESTNLSTLPILDIPVTDTIFFFSKLDMLLTWGITSHQYGPHRPYAVATILSHWADRSESRALRRGAQPPGEMLQDCLFRWLDTAEVVREEGNEGATAVMFAELVWRGKFSYSRYIQRLIARGEGGLLAGQEPQSRHRQILKSLPLPDYSAPVANQRKVALYGISCRSTPEDIKERELRRMLRACLPELFGGSPLPMDAPLPLDAEALLSASRYEQVRVLRHWFCPIFEKYIQQPSKRADIISLQTYITLMHIMSLIRTYRIMLEINLKLLPYVTSPDLLASLIDTIRRYGDIWACMDAHPALLDALCKAHETWNWTNKQAQCRPLLCLLIEFMEHRDMSQAVKQRINDDASALVQGLRPPTSPSQREPSLFPRIGMLLQEDDTGLATTIWMRHGFAVNWVHDVWQHTLEALRDIRSRDGEDNTSCNARALRYAQFLWDIDQHLLPGSFDQLVYQWAIGPGKTEFRHFDEDNWTALSVLLLYLVAKDALSAPNVLRGVVYPIWEFCCSNSGPSIPIMLSGANHIARHLLVPDRQDTGPMLTYRLDEIQKLQTRRRAVYIDENFGHLVSAMPNLVNLEHKQDLPEVLRTAAGDLRTTLSKDSEFRMVAFRNLELVSKAFWNSDSSQTLPDSDRHLGNALQEILSDSEPCELKRSCVAVHGCPTESSLSSPFASLGVLQISSFDWRTLSSFLSPWRYARTAIELQLALRGLAAGLKDEELKEKANKDMEDFGASFFGQALTSDETDLSVDMLRGVSGVVACKLINSGMQRIAQLFHSTTFDEEPARQLLHNAGETLHLMSSILQPLRSDPSGLPTLESDVQDVFAVSIKAATEHLHGATEAGNDTDYVTDMVVIVARLWQFDLCLPGAWTPKMKEIVPGILKKIVEMVIKYSYGMMANSVVFDVLLDTAFVLFDEIPRDTKAVNPDFFQYVVPIPPSSLPSEMTPLQRRRVSSLLSFVPDNAYVSSLLHSWTDPTTGETVFGPPVQDSPWEWSDSIEPHPSTSEITRENKPELRNSSSIPLEVFGTRPTGERVFGEVESGVSDKKKAERDMARARQLEDGLAGDSMFERDWRETRMNPDCVDWKTEGAEGGSGKAGATGAGDGNGGDGEGRMEGVNLASRASSPAPTVRSSATTTGTGATLHHGGPSQRASSVMSTSSKARSSLGDVTETGTGSGRGAKRKAPDEVGDSERAGSSVAGRGRGRPKGTGVVGRGKGKKK